MLYHGNGKPLFEQLKDIVLQRIEMGDFETGSKIPSEREFSERYKISRVTVRQALNDLVNMGVLTKQHGKGYFVAASRIEQKLGNLLGFIEEFENRNMHCETHAVQRDYIAPKREVMKKLELSEGSRVLLLVRCIFVDGNPLGVDYTYIPENVAYLLNGLNLENIIIYRILEQNGYNISSADQSIAAAMTSKEDADLLGISENDPSLVINRVTRLNNGQPIIFSETVYRGDRYNYLLTLNRYPTAIAHTTEEN